MDISLAVGKWASDNIAELRDRRLLIPAVIVSVVIWALVGWGATSAVRWVL